MYQNNPMLNQQMAQLEQEFLQKKQNLMQNFYSQNQQNNYQNTQPSAQPQPAPTPTQNVNWIQVNGLQGAKEHQVPANATHWLMDSTEDAFYVKSSDEFGVIKSFSGYRFSAIPQEELSDTPKPVDMSQYVTRDDFNALMEKLERLTNAQEKQPAKADKGAKSNG
ncbi:MAG: hypothetical protein HDR01_05640 [Lachnospiraceae bacterium]|nr:hypothetical protein [Lachnospiraceae bacterium]